MLTALKLAAWLLVPAMLLAGCGTLQQGAVTGSPLCRLIVNQLAAETDAMRRIEITEGAIRAGCVRRPT